MKRNLLFIILALGIITAASAQGRNWDPRDFNPRNYNPNAPRLNREEAKVTGELTLVKGFMAVKSGDTVYMAVGLNRYIGFIDSLKYGARVSL